MKKIRKLSLRPGQELSMQQQQLVIAGSGGSWISEGCSCSHVGNFHLEQMKVTVSDPDYLGALAGGLGVIGSALAVGSGVGAVSGLLGASASLIGFYNSMNRTSTITYKRKQTATSINPLRHSPGTPYID